MNSEKTPSPLDNEKTKEYFSKIAEKEGVNKASNVDKFEEIKSLLLPHDEHISILECGGGGGFYTNQLLNIGYRVTCVDLSHEALVVNLNNAKKIGKENKLKTVESDFVDFCKSNKEKFDQVVFIKVLHHFSSLKDIEYALLGAVEHCQKGSRVVIFEPNGTNPFWRFFLSFQKGMSGRSKWFYEQNMKFTTVKNLSNILDIIKLASNRKIRYKIGYHYVIPAMITKKHKRHSLLDKINNLLESSWLKKWFSFNISIIIDIE